MKTQTIEIKTGGNSLTEVVDVVQEDSGRILHCIITDMELRDTYSARIYAVKPSKADIYNDCVINGNTVESELTEQMLAEVGDTVCQIRITNDSAKVVSSFDIILRVSKSRMSESAVKSSSEYTALESAMVNAEKAVSEAEAAVLEAKKLKEDLASVTYEAETKTLNICSGGITSETVNEISDYVIEKEVEKIILDGVELDFTRYVKRTEFTGHTHNSSKVTYDGESGVTVTKGQTISDSVHNLDKQLSTTERSINNLRTHVDNNIADLEISKVEQSDLEAEVSDQLDGVKVDIVQEVLAQINGEAGSIFGQVNEDGTITITTDLAEGDYTIMYENEDGSLSEVGTITVGEVTVYYSIARTLTACTSNKTETNIEEGSAWTETITANDGHQLSSVVVTMGGTDVTSSVFSGGVLTISEVTGNIEITATATEIVEEAYTNLFDTLGTGYTNSGTKFYTNWIPYNQTDNSGKGTIYHFKGLADDAGYTNPYKMQFATDSSGSNASSQVYCSNANVQANVAASYDNSVKLLQHNTNNTTYTYVQFEIRETLPDNLIITANQDIIDE